MWGPKLNCYSLKIIYPQNWIQKHSNMARNIKLLHYCMSPNNNNMKKKLKEILSAQLWIGDRFYYVVKEEDISSIKRAFSISDGLTQILLECLPLTSMLWDHGESPWYSISCQHSRPAQSSGEQFLFCLLSKTHGPSYFSMSNVFIFFKSALKHHSELWLVVLNVLQIPPSCLIGFPRMHSVSILISLSNY